jgi:hypothetical protein
MKCYICRRGNSKAKGINKIKIYPEGNAHAYCRNHFLCKIKIKTKKVEVPKVDLIFEPVSADWKDFEGFIEQLKPALERLGISMVEDPDYEGSDTYGFLLSNRPMTEKEIMDQSIIYNLLPDGRRVMQEALKGEEE